MSWSPDLEILPLAISPPRFNVTLQTPLKGPETAAGTKSQADNYVICTYLQ